MKPLIYVTQKSKPTCRQADDCDPHENPEHHVSVEIAPGILDPVKALLSAAQDGLDEIEAEIETDSERHLLPNDGPTLLYRVAKDLRATIKRTQRLLEKIDGKEI